MGKRVADQHAVMDRGWEHAETLAAELARHGHGESVGYTVDCSSCDALRHYEEERQS